MLPKLLKRPEVEEITGLSCASIYRLMSEGVLPRPIKVGTRAVRWRATDIADYLANRPAGASGKPQATT